MMKVLSKSIYKIWQIGIQKTQCVHRMRLRPFLPQDEIEDTQFNQNDLYTDANAVEDAYIFDENLPATQEDTSDEELEKEADEINHQTELPPFSHVYTPEVNARWTSIKHDDPLGRHRQSLARTQHPPMEIDEDHDERSPCTLDRAEKQIYDENSPTTSQNNTDQKQASLENFRNCKEAASSQHNSQQKSSKNINLQKQTSQKTVQSADTKDCLKMNTKQHTHPQQEVQHKWETNEHTRSSPSCSHRKLPQSYFLRFPSVENTKFQNSLAVLQLTS